MRDDESADPDVERMMSAMDAGRREERAIIEARYDYRVRRPRSLQGR
jgi:hypothetical protein